MDNKEYENLLSIIDNADGSISQSIGSLINMSDENFIVLAPSILAQYEKSLTNTATQIALAQSFNTQGLKYEEIQASFEQISTDITANTSLSKPKKDFLLSICSLFLNAIANTEGLVHRIINVPIELCHENAKLPVYAHATDAGIDIYALEEITLAPGETKLIPTGIKMAIPNGYAMLVHPRSGMSARTKLRIGNSIGLIDSGYRDEIKVIMENTDPYIRNATINEDGTISNVTYGQSYTIGKGERFAQFRLVEVPTVNFVPVNSVLEFAGDRQGGFGSSGKE